MSEPPIILVSILTALAIGALIWVLLSSARPNRSRALVNLQRGHVGPEAARGETQQSGLSRFARRVTPPPLVALLERQHARAGRPANWPIDRLLTLKAALVPFATAVIGLLLMAGTDVVLVLVTVAAALLGYFLPDLLLVSRGQERDQRIETELADTLDQMTIAVEAGLGFDAAMARAASNGKGALAEEFTRTLQDIRMGVTRQQAFDDLGRRNEVADLRQFVRAIQQADAFGISIGDVLRTQAGEMRLKRRQRAEAKAQQVPVKVVFPLIVCILPALFIVVIGPAVMNIISAFSNV